MTTIRLRLSDPSFIDIRRR